MQQRNNRLGLSLSGGGFRAAAFHLGTLRKLYKMKLLNRVEIISTISGGAIIGSYYCLHQKDFAFFDTSFYESLKKYNLIRGIYISATIIPLLLLVLLFLVPSFYLLFTNWAWISPVLVALFIFVLLKFQFKIFRGSRKIESLYNQIFFKGLSLDIIPESPTLLIGSTNLETSRLFTFSRDYMGDSSYHQLNPSIQFTTKDFPLARAVSASTAVPFGFEPITIKPKFYSKYDDSKKVNPLLVDGGVYDNQGLHKLAQPGRYQCEYIITSDASTGYKLPKSITNTLSLLLATSNAFMYRIKNSQMVKDIYLNTQLGNKSIAYFSLGWDIENCIPGFFHNLCQQQIPFSTLEALELKREWIESPLGYKNEIINYLEMLTGYDVIPKLTAEEKSIIRSVSTSLKPLSEIQLDCLIKQAEGLTELQVKLYCPLLLK